MDKHQKLRSFGLLVTGFALSHLVDLGLRHRRAPVPVTQGQAELLTPNRATSLRTASWRYADDQPKKKKRKRDFLTNNAVVAGVVSAIVAGIISFIVAQNQSQDAVTQAQVAQQIQQAGQLETAAVNLYYLAGDHLCALKKMQPPDCFSKNSSIESLIEAEDIFSVDVANMSDPQAVKYAGQFEYGITETFLDAKDTKGFVLSGDMVLGYRNLLDRCGQLIQGKH